MIHTLGRDRRGCPTAWELSLRECRAGLRRHAGTDLGDQYQKVLAHGGEGDYSEPSLWERTLGDILSPTRPGRMVDVVNVVTRETGIDAETWRYDRLLSMLAQVEQTGPKPDL